jgi:hypothetical protein
MRGVLAIVQADPLGRMALSQITSAHIESWWVRVCETTYTTKGGSRVRTGLTGVYGKAAYQSVAKPLGLRLVRRGCAFWFTVPPRGGSAA